VTIRGLCRPKNFNSGSGGAVEAVDGRASERIDTERARPSKRAEGSATGATVSNARCPRTAAASTAEWVDDLRDRAQPSDRIEVLTEVALPHSTTGSRDDQTGAPIVSG
jgi:hypothetical protein